MLQKFALAFKTKTIEFFAEDEEEEEEYIEELSIPTVDLDPATEEEVIPGQRVVVIKPDPRPRPDPQALIASLFAAVSSFRAAYLHLQAAQSPFDPDAISSADRSAVSHIRRLYDLKLAYYGLPNSNPNPNLNPSLLSSHLEAQVQENQSLLRSFETVFNRLQSDIDRREAEASALRQTLRSMEAANSKLARRLERACSPLDDNVDAMLSISVFDSVLKESCRATHCFTRILIDLMKSSGWALDLAASSIYPDVVYAKPGHYQYAILSYICLRMFGDFGSDNFSCEEGRIGSDVVDAKHCRVNSLRQFIEHSAVDPLDLISASPSCGFAKFCEKKYQQLISPGMESSLFGNSDQLESVLGSLRPSSSLYESFVNMASSIWILHKLALAYNPRVEIFQVGWGTNFSTVYMESVFRSAALMASDRGKTLRPKVGFTVVPGFRVGKTVIQCRVYLDGLKQSL